VSFDTKRKADFKPSTTQAVDTPVANPQSDAARIAEAKARLITRERENNKHPLYSFQHDNEYWTSVAGEATSYSDAANWLFLAKLLETPILTRSQFSWSGSYDGRIALFQLSDCPPVPLTELKSAVKTRIRELGVSEAKLWERLCEPAGLSFWYMEDLEAQILRFREKRKYENHNQTDY
jgi:hypothetical protein